MKEEIYAIIKWWLTISAIAICIIIAITCTIFATTCIVFVITCIGCAIALMVF